MKRYFWMLLLITSLLFTGSLLVQAGPDQQLDPQIKPPAIVRFESVEESLDFAAVEAGTARTQLAWQVANYDSELYDLELQNYQTNGWVSIDVTDEAQGEKEYAVRHPNNFGQPMFRLMLRQQNIILEEQIVVIPYRIDPNVEPVISVFDANLEEIDRASLVGDTRVGVAWVVENRTPYTQLVFEQFVEDGIEPVNIEIPRANFWVPSQGEGPVDPVDIEDSRLITLQLRVYDVRSGETLATEGVTLAITESLATTTPSALATPGEAEEESSAVIQSFTGTALADREDTITLEWNVANATDISITRLSDGGAQFMESIADDLPAQGSLEYALPDAYSESAQFVLIAYDDQRRPATEYHAIDMNCPFDTTLSDTCPFRSYPEVEAAFQAFEGGYMLWRGDTNKIYVLYLDGSYNVYDDTYTEGDTVGLPDVPPEGLFQPQRGFGKLWTENVGVRDRLGWATSASEAGYTAAIEELLIARRPNTVLMTLPDNRVVQMAAFGWERLD